MIAAILSLLATGGVVALTARGLYVAIEHEERYQQTQLLLSGNVPQDAPDNCEPLIEKPHHWGGRSPADDLVPDLVPVYPRSQMPAPEPAHLNPITQSGSANWVMSEPHPEPSPEPDLVALMRGCPYPVTGPFGTDEFALFRALKAQKKTQTEVIETIWGAARGGTQKYQLARERYLALTKTLLTINYRSN